jgi:hypothetical protein
MGCEEISQKKVECRIASYVGEVETKDMDYIWTIYGLYIYKIMEYTIQLNTLIYKRQREWLGYFPRSEGYFLFKEKGKWPLSIL